MEKILKRVFFAFVLVLSMFFGIFTDVYAYDEINDEAKRTIKYINEIRTRLSLPEYEMNEMLVDMATNHSKYMSLNNTFTSVEEADKSNYTGKYPRNRASHAKYKDDYVFEFIVENINNYEVGINDILSEPLNRSVLLNPTYNQIGMSIDNGYATFDIGGKKQSLDKFIIYPYDKQENVATKISGKNFKNYLKHYDKELPEYVGTPITVTYYGDKIDSINDIKAKVIDRITYKEIDTLVVLKKDYYFLNNTLVIIPTQAYDYDKEYEVSISFTANFKSKASKSYDGNIKFRTDEYKKDKSAKKFVTRGQFVEKLVKNENYKLSEPTNFKFSDVQVNNSLSKYIYAATNNKLINGMPDGTFAPNLNITREQAYLILVRAYEKKNGQINIKEDSVAYSYSDDFIEASAWAINYIKKARKIGIVLEGESYKKYNDYLTEKEYDKILEKYTESKNKNKDKK